MEEMEELKERVERLEAQGRVAGLGGHLMASALDGGEHPLSHSVRDQIRYLLDLADAVERTVARGPVL